MKKLAMFMALVLPLMFASCSNDDEPKVKNDNFDTILTWGASKTEIKAEIAQEQNLVLLTENENGLVYSLPNNKYPWYGFIFNESGLVGSSIYFTDAMFDEYDFNGYLKDNGYVYIEDTEDGAIYANNKKIEKATITCEVSFDGEDEVWTALWQPTNLTKAGEVSLMQEAKALYKAAK